MLEIGSLVDGKYKILNKVGTGGMSVVYLAMNEKANKQWALKEVRKEGVQNFEIVKQGLVAEVKILKKLKHPNLPSIVDVIDQDDFFIIVMDYIEGISLDKAESVRTQEDVIFWAKQLCDVLGYLHSRTPPIIYRDMKPSNIMLKPDGNVTLIDFGTAREYKEKSKKDTDILGTPGFAAPEQYGGMGQTDGRTDIYGLGATIYNLLTGRDPIELTYKEEYIKENNPSLSGGILQIILKCTRPNADDRYQSAAELMYALEHYEEIDDVFKKKQKNKLFAFLACVTLTVACAVISVWGYVSAENKKGENYDFLLSNASSVSDYYEAIVTDPLRTEAYLGNADTRGLIDLLISDGELTGEENSVLNKLKGGLEKTDARNYSSTVNVLEEMKKNNPEGYEEVCYQIGEAYLFYYNVGVEKDKYATAATWFQYATANHPVAKMYCDISTCLQNIAKFSKAEQFANLYKEYETLWEQVCALQRDSTDFDDDLKLRVWNEIVDMIRNNAKEFCEVSPQSEITALLDGIMSDSRQITNTFLQESIASLADSIESTKTKIQSVKVGKTAG